MLEARMVNDGALLQPKVSSIYACSPECRFCREICGLPARKEGFPIEHTIQYRTSLEFNGREIPVEIVAMQLRPHMTMVEMRTIGQVDGVPDEQWERLLAEAARLSFPDLLPPEGAER